MEDDMNVSGKEAKTLLKDEVMDVVEQRLQQIGSNDETFMTKCYHTHDPDFTKLDQTVVLEQNEDTNLGGIQAEGAARNVLRKLIAEKNDSTTTKKDEGSVEKLHARVAELEDKLKEKQKSSELQLKDSGESFCARVSELEQNLIEEKRKFSELQRKKVEVISELLISASKAERREARAKFQLESLKFGKVASMRMETVPCNDWEEGQLWVDLINEHKDLMKKKVVIERELGSLNARGPLVENVNVEDYQVQVEILETKLESIKRDEDRLSQAKDHYKIGKGRHILEMKRIQSEDESAFNKFQMMNRRYLLLNLLGKGGFSEVYKAYDLMEDRYVACKFHVIDLQQTQESQNFYSRHAKREFQIQSSLKHCNIVRLLDMFQIESTKFCTVLEYCAGGSLEQVLKATPVLSEQEARVIMVQIFHAFVHLNRRRQRIIHFDLKPGNVLLDEFGVAKITDFGLSKIMKIGSHEIVLSSPGAGTLWYLPPECFTEGALISSKVDVWSAGVLLFQMLYGKRPFCEGKSALTIWNERAIINAHNLTFPEFPIVSDEAKAFMRRCLTYEKDQRPDVIELSEDPYLHYVALVQ